MYVTKIDKQIRVYDMVAICLLSFYCLQTNVGTKDITPILGLKYCCHVPSVSVHLKIRPVVCLNDECSLNAAMVISGSFQFCSLKQ